MRVADYIFGYLQKKGVRHIFTISGGGNIHLIDALGRSKIKYICNYHEQASATAAEGYARLTGNMGVALVTTGPGGTNAITGVAGAWLDSIPTMTISGQVRREILGIPKGLRQLGPQEINIVEMVKPITKYAVTVMDPQDILYHLDKAWYLAKTGRPGPVWIDIPLDVQGVQIIKKKLRRFNSTEMSKEFETDKKKLKSLVLSTLKRLQSSQRPVLYAGNGIRLAGAYQKFLELVNLLKVPVLLSYVGYDMLPSDHPYNYGRAHSLGQRAANFILQNSDFLLSIGARLDILTTGYTYKAFARGAYKVMVDTDKNEITKSTLSIDLPVHYDAKDFIVEMICQLKARPMKHDIAPWLAYGKKMTVKYPPIPADAYKDVKRVNYYAFIDVLGSILRKNEIIVESDGVGPLNCMYQAFHVREGQRVILNLGCAQMGYGLPAAIGVSFAAKGRRVICLEGDGSLQLNIHELQVLKQHNLPIKLFVYSNDGYLSIRNTQKSLFGSFLVASDSSSGVVCPDYTKVGRAYGLKTIRIHNHRDMKRKILYALNYPGPILVDINAARDFVLTPKLQTKKMPDGSFVSPTLEDMAPFLSESELKENMIIDLWKEKK